MDSKPVLIYTLVTTRSEGELPVMRKQFVDKSEYDKLNDILNIVRRYHFGDGTITKEMLADAIGESDGL